MAGNVNEMKRVLALLLSVAATVAFGQESSTSIFNSVRTDIMIVAREHTGGADVLEVKVLDPNYKEAELQRQINLLGEILKSPPRALRIYRNRFGDQPSEQFLEASFGVDGIAEPGKLRLNAIAQAFASEQVKGIGVVFENRAVDATAISVFRSESIEVEGQRLPGSIGLEYRIHPLTTDTAKYDVPDAKNSRVESSVAKVEPSRGLDPSIYALIAVAAIALGALVYSFLRRGKSSFR
ncbi:hypothetical protein MCEMSE15_01003 [Fimbriimonadaceae bacterium]